MKYIIYFILLTTSLTTLLGQKNAFTIKGQIIEASSGQSIDYATVLVLDKATKTMISGTTTESGGIFSLGSATDDIIIEVSFIGYATKRLEDIQFIRKLADLGAIRLGEDTKTLDEVIVTAAKSTTEFKLDKRVFNVGTDLSSTGASALEILNNVPSVNVDIEGQVSLRGSSGVQILINGKPSVLADDQSGALGTITADMIEKIEVITNPSAKYEAEGTAGILNIVLKKNQKKGINGSISLNTGVPHNHSVGVSLNRRTEKFNLFAQLGVGYRELPRDQRNINRDLLTGTEIISTGNQFRNENFYNFILGTDYYINPQNVITLSGSYAYEIEDQPSEIFFTQSQNDVITKEWRRNEITEANNPKLQYELQYKRDFTDNKEHKLLFSAIGNFFGKDQSSTFENTILSGTDNLNNQRTATSFQEGKYTFNLDYTKPFANNWTVETGAQYLTNNVSNDFEVRNEIQGEFIVDQGLTNIFDFDQKVLGIYTTGAYEASEWGVKLGLRVENTDLSTFLVNTNEENAQNFTDFFPSFHTSYKITEGISVQGGYSRRIYRPRLWDLNPFFNIRNNFSIRAGNPNLQAEYTDSYEVGTIFIKGQTSLNFNLYHRYTTDKIERVSIFDNNVTTFIPQNIGINRSTGLELNAKYSPTKKVTITGDANYNIFDREGTFGDQVFDFSADQWSLKSTAKYKASKKLDLEVTGRYQSREQTVQGIISDNLFADFGLRYKILNGKGVFNLSVRDVFASRIRENTIRQDKFFIYSRGQRGRFVTFGFSYGFGKGEAMQFSGARRR